jgi:hypothetical protein
MINIKKLSESIGIDLIPYIFGKSFKKESQIFKFNEIKEKLLNFSEKKVNEAILYSKEIYDSENKRLEVIENKAHNLLAVTGIATAFVIGVSDILPSDKSLTVQIIFSFLYLIIAFSLILTILSSFRVIKVGDYKIASLEIEDVFGLSTSTILFHKIDVLASYIYSYKNNEHINNKKAIFLIGAQKWFRNSIILFLIFSIFLISTNYQNLNTFKMENEIYVVQTIFLPTETMTISPYITQKNTIAINQLTNTQPFIITKSPTKLTPSPNN